VLENHQSAEKSVNFDHEIIEIGLICSNLIQESHHFNSPGQNAEYPTINTCPVGSNIPLLILVYAFLNTFISGTTDAYVTIQLGKEKYQTSVVEKSESPVWDEECDL
jgi:hypothetical protein